MPGADYLKIDFSTSSVTLRVAVCVALLAALPRISPEVEPLLDFDDPPVMALPTLVPTLRLTLPMTAVTSVPKMVRFHPDDFLASFSASLAWRAASR